MTMTTAKRRLGHALAALLTVHSLAAPALAAERPYFRLNLGNGAAGGTTDPDVPGKDTDNVKVVVSGGPSGAYALRSGASRALPTPTATPRGVTWSLDGPVPSGMTVDAGTGAVSWTAGAVQTNGPLRLVATFVPPAGGDALQGRGAAFSAQSMGAPFISYSPPAGIASGSRYDLAPVVGNVASGRYALNRQVPAGLAFSEDTGVVSVLAGASGTYSGLAVTVTDSDGAGATSNTFSLAVSGRPASVSMPSASGVRDVPFQNTIAVSGLTAPITYDKASANLPPGLDFCSNPERVCGVPTAAGTFEGIVVRATGADGVGTVSTTPATITIAQPSLSYAGQTVALGTPFSVTPTRSNLDGATFAFASAPPSGVSVAPDTGVVSGNLTSTDPVTLVVNATNRYGTYASVPFTLKGKLESFSVSSSSSVVRAHVGYPVRQQFTASPSDPSMTWSVDSGTLPVGLALGAGTGLVSGSGTAPADVAGVVVKATTAGGESAAAAPTSYQIKALPTVTSKGAYAAVVGTPFSVTLSATDLIGAGSYATDTSRLPPGIVLSSSGTLSGTPTADGTYDGIAVGVTDAYDGAVGQGQPFSIQVTPASTDLAVTGVPSQYKVRQASVLTTQAPSVVNAQSGVAWDLAPGSAQLPDGMRVDPATGVISGASSSPGDTANVILRATETGTKSGALDTFPRVRLASADPSWTMLAATTAPARRSAVSRPFTITVAPRLEVTNVSPNYSLKIASAVSVNPQASGVLGSTTWRLSGATLPQALGFDVTTGRIAGPALAAGRVPDPAPSTMTLTAVDSFDGATATSTPFAFQVDPGLVVVGPTRLEARAGNPYASGTAFGSTNASGSVSWTVVGTLPDGLRVNGATGEISGTPSTPGSTADLRMQAVQSDGQAGVSPPFTFVVRGGLDVSMQAYNVAHVNKPMAPIVPAVTGAVGNVRWSVASGSLPPGMRMDPTTGAIQGTPTSTGIFHNLMVAAADPTGNSGVSQEVVIEVNNGMTWATTLNFPTGRRGQRLSTNAPRISGASGAITWKIVSNYADWTVDQATGVITGAAVTGYVWQDWFVATDASGQTLSHPTILTPITKAFEYPGNSSTDGFVGFGMTSWPGYTFESQGLVSWTKEGTWPDWVSLDPVSGYASGTPPAAGTYRFTTRATDTFDGTGGTFVRTFNVTDIPKPDPGHGSYTFRSPRSYSAVDPLFTAPDSVPGNLTWSLPGNLPYGLGFHANGRSVGLDRYYTTPGFYPNLTFTATSDQGGTYTMVYDVTVLPPVGVEIGGGTVCAFAGQTFTTPSAKLSGLQGTPTVGLYDFYGTTLPYPNSSWPAWLTIDATGAMSGTVPNDDSGSFYLRYGAMATDAADGAVGYASGYSYLRTYGPSGFDLPAQMAQGYVARLPDGYGYYDGGNSMAVHGDADGNARLRITKGALPEGMSFSDNRLYGNPVTPGKYPVTFTLSMTQCGQPRTVSKDVVLDVRSRDPEKYIVNPVSVYARVGVPFRSMPVPYVANKGTENWSFDQRNGGRPAGVSFDSGSGAFYGTPTQTFNDSYRLQAWSDQGGYTLGTWSSFVVTPGPAIAMADVNVTAGVPASVSPNASGFAGPVTWGYSGTLPPGMSFDPSAGALIGTATTTGTYGPITFSGREETLPQVGPNDPTPAYPSATSNGFNVVVTGGPTISGVADQTHVIGEAFFLSPTTSGFSGPVTWGQSGDFPAGVGLDKSTGIVSGIGTAYATRTMQLQASDASGNTILSAPFVLKVTDGDGKTPPNGPATWRWGAQVCTYACRNGVCSGRQLQNCTGSGCEVTVRGCDAPYKGGDTSYPVGNLATSCDAPLNDPNETICPIPPTPAGPVPAWTYFMYYLQTKHTHGFVVNHFRLACFKGAEEVDVSLCPPAPTTVTDCGINGYGQGYCATNVPTQNGVQQTSTGGPAGWYD